MTNDQIPRRRFFTRLHAKMQMARTTLEHPGEVMTFSGPVQANEVVSKSDKALWEALLDIEAGALAACGELKPIRKK